MSPSDAAPDEISRNDVRDALLRSGYLIEHRLETILWQRGYYAVANEAYPDPETGKARELDVYGMYAVRPGPKSGILFSSSYLQSVSITLSLSPS